MPTSFLSALKPDDVVVRQLHVAGFVTDSLTTIEAVENGIIFIEGADGDYAKDSVYAFSMTTGKSINNYMPGGYSSLVRIASEEDIKAFSEEDE